MRDILKSVVEVMMEYGPEEDIDSHSFAFLCNVVDTLNWVLGEITTERFISPDFLDLDSWLKVERKLREDFL